MMDKIFISSTCYDLIDLRAEIKEFLIKNKLTPIMSDEIDSHFIIHETNSIETCLVNLRDSDIVILILSQRYGASLEKSGFGDFSATHLEYKEAILQEKKIMVFVRDRLEADYNQFRKTENIKGLSWIREKDIKLFQIIDEHKKLSANPTNNWYYTFKNSVEIKKRLSIELKRNFADIRLQYLIENDKMPFLDLSINVDSKIHYSGFKIKIFLTNIGNIPLIKPIFNFYKGKYSEQNDNKIKNYEFNTMLPLKGEGIFELDEDTPLNDDFVAYYSFDFQYKNTYGEKILQCYNLEVDCKKFYYIEDRKRIEGFELINSFELIETKILD